MQFPVLYCPSNPESTASGPNFRPGVPIPLTLVRSASSLTMEYGMSRQHPETRYFSGWTTRGNSIPSPEMKHKNGGTKIHCRMLDSISGSASMCLHQPLMIGAGPLAGSRSSIQRYGAGGGATAFVCLICLMPVININK